VGDEQAGQGSVHTPCCGTYVRSNECDERKSGTGLRIGDNGEKSGTGRYRQVQAGTHHKATYKQVWGMYQGYKQQHSTADYDDGTGLHIRGEGGSDTNG